MPVNIVGENGFKVLVDLNLYSKEALAATLYRYTDNFYIHQQVNSENECLVNIVFEVKDDGKMDAETVKCFCNDLIDQQVRVDINAQFGHIRDLIVEEAFKPVQK